MLNKIILILACALFSNLAYTSDDLTSNRIFAYNSLQNGVKAILHPAQDKKINTNNFIVLYMPMPPGVLKDAKNISIFSNKDHEMKFYVEPHSWWRNITNNEILSIRSLKIYLKINNTSSSHNITINNSGDLKHRLSEKPSNVKEFINKDIILHKGNDKKIINIKEPIVYTIFPKEWLSLCMLRNFTIPLNKNKKLKWFDEAFINFSEAMSSSIVNNKDSDNKISLLDFEPWMYDLPATLFNVYIRTGELKWLQQAHITSQIYAAYVNELGQSTFKEHLDLKHSYNLSMFIDYLLVGDYLLLDKIENIATFTSKWREDYKEESNFWTERHQTYSLLGSLIAWEATGKSEYADRATLIAKATMQEANTPEAGWEPQGCVLHTIRDHEGDPDDRPVCSPWMSALLSDAMFRYYIHSENDDVLKFLYDLADFISTYGIYEVTTERHMKGVYVPWYLASKNVEYTDDGPWADREHACDVSGLLARGYWAGKKLKLNTKNIEISTNRLLATCKKTFSLWYRTSKTTKTKYWKLTPPRKYNWWFGTTSDLPFLINTNYIN